MKRRIFIAINLPDSCKKRLVDFRQKWEHLPVRWTKKDSLHLTLVFIGYADEEEIYEICRLAKETAARKRPFYLNFEKILYGPPDKIPRMIWLEGRISKEITEIKRGLEEALESSDALRSFRAERRFFSPHITIARIKMEQWRALPKNPEIQQDFKTSIPVASIDVMESDLKRDGAEYTILESCALNGEI